MKQNRLTDDWQGLYPDFRRVGVYNDIANRAYAAAGLMFWFSWNRFVGSYFALSAASRV
jgi:hypothetical protein